MGIESGFLFINKPAGITSFGVVARLRKITGVKRIGHSGTLDPFATGLLIIAVGRESTRELHKWLKKDKTYRATLRLGATSTTGDIEGQIQERSHRSIPSDSQIQEVLARYIGEIQQKPHRFSAVKIQGKPAYHFARKGIEVSLHPRSVQIHKLSVISYNYPELIIESEVSSGTYIRVLAEDIGEDLGCGAYLTELHRISIDNVTDQQAVSLEQVTKENWQTFLHP